MATETLEATTTPRTAAVPPRMRAAVYTTYGPAETIKVDYVETPVPADDEVLIRVRAAALNPLDWRILRGGSFVFRLMFGLSRPKVRPARDVAGEVVAIGRKIRRFQVGDQVFGICIGAASDYACAREGKIALKPASMTFEDAAAIPIAGITALQGLRDFGVQAGSKVLINGAAGGVGTFSVQVAKWLGAQVTAVCSANNVALVRSLGADRVIDYTHEDVTKTQERFDVILENVGNLPLAALKQILRPWGRTVMAGAPKEPWAVIRRIVHSTLLNAFYLSMRGRRVFHTFIARIGTKDLEAMAALIAEGKIKPVIDRAYAIDHIAEAVRYLEGGHAPGKVIILPDRD